jgi:hypothetical protein
MERNYSKSRAAFHVCETFGLLSVMLTGICTVVGSKTITTFMSPRTGSTETLKIKGNWLDTKVDIVNETTGMVVAQIDCKLL